MQKIRQAKEDFINVLFATEVVKGSNGKKVDTRIVVKNIALNKHFNTLYGKYMNAYNHDKQAFLTDCLFYANQAISNFEITDAGSWNGVVDGSDKVNIARIITSIKTTVTHEIAKLNSNGYVTSRKITHEDGTTEKVTAVVSIKMDSTDRLIDNSEEDESCERQIENAQNFWSSVDGHETTFAKWFNAHKHKILTKSQIELLEKLNSIQFFQAKEILTREELSNELGGMNIDHVNIKIGKIRDRIAKRWAKERSVSNKTYLEQNLEETIALMEHGLSIIDNETFSDFVKMNIDNKSFERIIDALNCNDTLAINEALENDINIPSAVLSKIAIQMEAELVILHQQLENERVAKQTLVRQSDVKKDNTFKPAKHGKTIYLYVDANGVELQEK